MSRAAPLLCLVVGCALSGVFAASVLADDPAPPPTTTTGTTTTPPPTTTTTAPPPATTTAPLPAPKPKPKPVPKTISDRVTIGSVSVGGLTAAKATLVVRRAFAKPVVLRVAGHTFRVAPGRLGARAYVEGAVRRAGVADPGTAVSLVVTVHGSAARSYLAGLARRLNRTPVEARLSFGGDRPVISPDVPGRTLDRAAAYRALVHTLLAGSRRPLRLTVQPLAAAVTRSSFGATIVIHRGTNRLDLYQGASLRHEFAVATGQSIYPTPLGLFSIAVKERDPWWYPPTYDDWAKGLKPVPPGPSNPLGTRWMGLTAPGVGIHGTDEPGSIGYSASHGCIRMQVPDAEWLFERVSVGTPVDIVAS